MTRPTSRMNSRSLCSISSTVSPSSRVHLANERRQVGDLAAAQPGEGFVQQQQLGLGGERPRDLQPPLVAIGQHFHQAPPSLPPRPTCASSAWARASSCGAMLAAARPERADNDVFQHAHADERTAQLEGARDAQLGDVVRRQAQQVLAVEHDAGARSGAMKPVSRLNRVVLPAPLGPRTPMISPRSTEKLTFFTACRPPKRLSRFLTSSKALIGSPAPPSAGARRRDQAVRQEEQDQDQGAAVDQSRHSPKLRSNSVSSTSRIAPPTGP